MLEWLSTQPWWASVGVGSGIFLVGLLVGRWSKKTLAIPTGPIVKELRRIANAQVKKENSE